MRGSRHSVVLAWTMIAGLSMVTAKGWSATQGRPAPAAVVQELDVVPIQGNVYMIVGAGANIAMQIGDDGVLLVDTGQAKDSDRVLAAVRKTTSKPIRYIINTHAHPDHVGGNDPIVRASGGQRTAQGGGGGGVENPNGVQIFSHQNVANTMMDPGEGKQPYPDDAIPKFTFITKDKKLYFNGEAIDLWWHEGAHTDGDILVYFRRSDVVVAGDILQTEGYPRYDRETGGIQGILNGLNQVIDITVPRFNQMDGTRVIPGHGRICTESDVVELRDMATIIRDRIFYMVRQKKMSLADVKMAKPTFDYDPVYVSPGSRTPDSFIEAIYADAIKPLTGPQPMSGLNFSDGGR